MPPYGTNLILAILRERDPWPVTRKELVLHGALVQALEISSGLPPHSSFHVYEAAHGSVCRYVYILYDKFKHL